MCAGLVLISCNRSNDTENLYLVGKAANHRQTAPNSTSKTGAPRASGNDNVFESTQMDPFVAVSHYPIGLTTGNSFCLHTVFEGSTMEYP